MTIYTNQLEKAKSVTETLAATRTHAEDVASGEVTEHSEANERELLEARTVVLEWLHKKQDMLDEDEFEVDGDVDLLVETMLCIDYFADEPDERVAEALYERISKIYTAMVMYTTMLHAKQENSLEPEFDRTFQ